MDGPKAKPSDVTTTKKRASPEAEAISENAQRAKQARSNAPIGKPKTTINKVSVPSTQARDIDITPDSSGSEAASTAASPAPSLKPSVPSHALDPAEATDSHDGANDSDETPSVRRTKRPISRLYPEISPDMVDDTARLSPTSRQFQRDAQNADPGSKDGSLLPSNGQDSSTANSIAVANVRDYTSESITRRCLSENHTAILPLGKDVFVLNMDIVDTNGVHCPVCDEVLAEAG